MRQSPGIERHFDASWGIAAAAGLSFCRQFGMSATRRLLSRDEVDPVEELAVGPTVSYRRLLLAKREFAARKHPIDGIASVTSTWLANG